MNLGNRVAAMMSHPKMSNQPDSPIGTSLLDGDETVEGQGIVEGRGTMEGLGPELTSLLGNEGEF